MICRSYQNWKFPRVVPVIGIVVLLLGTFRLYGGAYFSMDDFNNLDLVREESLGQTLGHILNPVSSYFRPVGLMCYWLTLRFFDLNPAAYHWLAWLLHAANTAFVYFVLKQLTGSR